MGEPKLPQVGDVFMTATVVFADGDHAEVRPVVVVRPSRDGLDYVTVVQRSTTATSQSGVDHPKDPDLGLTKDGRWVLAYSRTVRCDQFLTSATLLGRLDDSWLAPLIEAWEQM